MKKYLVFVLVFMLLCSSAALAAKPTRRFGETAPFRSVPITEERVDTPTDDTAPVDTATVVTVPTFVGDEPFLAEHADEPAIVRFDAGTGRIFIACMGVPSSTGSSFRSLRIIGDPYTHEGVQPGTTGKVSATAVFDLPEKNVVFTSTGRIYIRITLFDPAGAFIAQATRSLHTDTRFRGKNLSITYTTPGAKPRGVYRAEVIFDVRAESFGVAALDGSYIDSENSGVKLKSISLGPDRSR